MSARESCPGESTTKGRELSSHSLLQVCSINLLLPCRANPESLSTQTQIPTDESPLRKRSQRNDKFFTTALASSLRFSEFLQTWDTWAMLCVPVASVLCSCWPCGWILHPGNLRPDRQHPRPAFGSIHRGRSDPPPPSGLESGEEMGAIKEQGN